MPVTTIVNPDAADYVVWRDGLGTAHTQDDYDDWVANFGATAGSGSPSGIVAVPDPSAVAHVVLPVVGMTGGRRQRSLRTKKRWNKETHA